MVRSTIARVLVAAALLGPLAAQCAYPKPPQGGFALTETLDTIVTFGDGARTKADVIHPTTPAACGWPTLIYIHGMTSNHTMIRDNARRLARRGFAIVTWTVRGQGDTQTLNNGRFGFEYVGAAERLDIVEMVAHVRQRHGTHVDTSRLGIFGFSQGAMYVWAAAAWSGRTLPANNRGLTTFPTFQVACPFWWAPLSGDVLVPQGKAFSGKLFEALYFFPPRLQLESAWFRRIHNLILREDYAGVAAIFDNDPFRQEHTLLKTSRVPVFTQVSWNDDWVPIAATLRTLEAMPKSTPRRAFLTFPGHDGPRTVKPMQFDITSAISCRWLDRFLKGTRNGVEDEAPFITGSINQTDQEFRTLEPVWNRYRQTWPPPHKLRTYYLRSGNRLTTQQPTGPEADDRVRHVVPATYGMAEFVRDRGSQAFLRRNIPLHTVPFDTAPLPDDFAVVGPPSVVIQANPSHKNYQLHCALYRVEPSGTETFLASGTALVRDPAPRAATLRVTMNHVDATVRRGQRLRLKLQNLTYRPVVDAINIFTSPYFESVDIDIRHSAAAVSSLTVPYEPGLKPALITSHLTLDTSRTPLDDVYYLIRAPTRPRSTPYVFVFGALGMAPGFPWNGSHVHMNWDPLLSNVALSALNTPVFPNTLGTLGSQVPHTPRLSLRQLPPLPPGILDARLVILAALGDGSVTNPVELFYR